MRLSPILLQNISSYPWLHNLKTAQLQRIAQATGIQSSGTKSILTGRLEAELGQCEYKLQQQQNNPNHSTRGNNHMSILSIDMGIQNLAFAHLLVGTDSSHVVPRLNAWRRLAVEEIVKDEIESESESGSETEMIVTPKSKSKSGSLPYDKSNFSPTLYAKHAYTLVSTLLARYQPTHVLIERQRFRSGGASAVQEWTLRVGVFEGMLYAVLHALSQERMGTGVVVPVVVGIEPQRVLRYWENGDGDEGEKKKKATAREGKKAKIGMVGRWLLGGSDASSSRISIGMDPQLRKLVGAYLCKWEGKKRSVTKRGSKSTAEDGVERPEMDATETETKLTDVKKLDDLADCLVQGVTWLEWHVMRHRISVEGSDAVLGRD